MALRGGLGMYACEGTLELATRLEAGGFSPEQSRSLAAALGEAAQTGDLVTKADIAERATKAVIAQLRAEMPLLEQRMTIRLGGMLVVTSGLLLAAMRYVH